MSLERYHEGLAAGLTRREAGLLAVGQELGSIFREARLQQESFMADIGYSMEELRAWPHEARPFLNDLYAAWRAEHGLS
jgi:hypothetical protein